MAVELTPFDPAEYLTTPEAQGELLADASESGDAAYLAHALGIVARARGMADLAAATGMTRQALRRSLSASGNPRLETVIKVSKALGLKVTIGT